MNLITLEATADLLVTSTITATIDMGLSIAHRGVTADGQAFVLVNGTDGQSVVIKL